ncbi:hypothetical protein HYQ44_004823 [Verticillium longisporum]|nr:hypothetical protein HYQ44_004823 [Verticillium longisporum]
MFKRPSCEDLSTAADNAQRHFKGEGVQREEKRDGKGTDELDPEGRARYFGAFSGIVHTLESESSAGRPPCENYLTTILLPSRVVRGRLDTFDDLKALPLGGKEWSCCWVLEKEMEPSGSDWEEMLPASPESTGTTVFSDGVLRSSRQPPTPPPSNLSRGAIQRASIAALVLPLETTMGAHNKLKVSLYLNLFGRQKNSRNLSFLLRQMFEQDLIKSGNRSTVESKTLVGFWMEVCHQADWSKPSVTSHFVGTSLIVLVDQSVLCHILSWTRGSSQRFGFTFERSFYANMDKFP